MVPEGPEDLLFLGNLEDPGDMKATVRHLAYSISIFREMRLISELKSKLIAFWNPFHFYNVIFFLLETVGEIMTER